MGIPQGGVPSPCWRRLGFAITSVSVRSSDLLFCSSMIACLLRRALVNIGKIRLMDVDPKGCVGLPDVRTRGQGVHVWYIHI